MSSGQLLLATRECVVDSYCWVLENVKWTATVGFWSLCYEQLLLGTGECVDDSY